MQCLGTCWGDTCTCVHSKSSQGVEASRAGEKCVSQLTDEVNLGSRKLLVCLEERVSNAEIWLCRCWRRYWCLWEAPPHGPSTCMMMLSRDGKGLSLSSHPLSPTSTPYPKVVFGIPNEAGEGKGRMVGPVPTASTKVRGQLLPGC